jgi:hypothetical protein
MRENELVNEQQRGESDRFTAICCLVTFILLLAALLFVALPLAAHMVDVVLRFWGLK